ncbi:MAG: hypothetical protein F4X36_11395 [Gammaproteobacteria bacterium]|nr:hypothetical protein [Gammaproteobacteria bacterium]
MPPPTEDASDWERPLSTAARLQRIVPDAVLVGGTAAALHVAHRLSEAPHSRSGPSHRERSSRALGTASASGPATSTWCGPV